MLRHWENSSKVVKTIIEALVKKKILDTRTVAPSKNKKEHT